MKHLFAPYELAVIAKEKGFDEYCFGWHGFGQIEIFGEDLQLDIYAGEENKPLAPTYQQLIDWFREKHRIMIVIDFTVDNDIIEYCIKISEPKTWDEKDVFAKGEIKNYYEALNTAIKEAFKLI